MNKLTLYKGLVVALAILNLALLSFLFFKKTKKRKSPREVIIERLAFSEEQTESYDELIKVHKANIKKSRKSIRSAKQALYTQLKMKEQNTIVLDSLKNEISLAQQTIENIHYNHFLDIKRLCKTKQIPAYESLTEEMSKLFEPKKRRKHRKR
jgi:archaellum biogenesis ATPase FlaH